MTLAVALGNCDQIVLAIDRRLTAGGRVKHDDKGKVGHAICDDASFLYCFTGLAEDGRGHVTSRWLLQALYNAAQKSQTHCYREIVIAFANEAAAYFSTQLQHLSAKDRRITFMFMGYLDTGHIVNSLITNFQDYETPMDHAEAQPDFSYRTEISRDGIENPTCVQAIGQFQALTPRDEMKLRKLLEDRKPADAVLQTSIAFIQEVSDRKAAGGTVGKKVTTARLQRSDPEAPIVGYGSDQVSSQMPLLDQVNLRTGAPEVLISDAQISTTSPFIFPRARRGAPCPCGSGKKYRHCHGQPPKKLIRGLRK